MKAVILAVALCLCANFASATDSVVFADVCGGHVQNKLQVVRVQNGHARQRNIILVQNDHVVRQFVNHDGDTVKVFASGKVKVERQQRVLVVQEKRVFSKARNRGNNILVVRQNDLIGAQVNNQVNFGLVNVNVGR